MAAVALSVSGGLGLRRYAAWRTKTELGFAPGALDGADGSEGSATCVGRSGSLSAVSIVHPERRHRDRHATVAGIVERHVPRFGLSRERNDGQHDRAGRLATSLADGFDELAGAVLAQVGLAIFLIAGQLHGHAFHYPLLLWTVSRGTSAVDDQTNTPGSIPVVPPS